MKLVIKYPPRLNEAEIQARLWDRLTEEGIDARLQIKVVSKSWKRPGRGHESAMLDIVIFKARQAVAIIECKSWSPQYIRNRKYQSCRNSKQLNRYTFLFGLPIFVCGCLDSIEPAILFARGCIEHSADGASALPGVTLGPTYDNPPEPPKNLRPWHVAMEKYEALKTVRPYRRRRRW